MHRYASVYHYTYHVRYLQQFVWTEADQLYLMCSRKDCRQWDLNPRPFGLEPKSSALDRSAISTRYINPWINHTSWRTLHWKLRTLYLEPVYGTVLAFSGMGQARIGNIFYLFIYYKYYSTFFKDRQRVTLNVCILFVKFWGSLYMSFALAMFGCMQWTTSHWFRCRVDGVTLRYYLKNMQLLSFIESRPKTVIKHHLLAVPDEDCPEMWTVYGTSKINK